MIKNYMFNFVFSVLPKTRMYKTKRVIANLLGMNVGKHAMLNGDIKLYGRGKIVIGENTWIGIGCQFVTSPTADICIGKNVDIGPFCKFVTGTHEIGVYGRRAGKGVSIPIRIGDGSWIGTDVVVLGGAQIGFATVVAAKALVKSGEYSPSILLAGVPALQKKIYSEN